MSGSFNTIDLDALALKSGEGRRLDAAVQPAPLDLGGKEYEFEGREVPVRIDISRTSSGYALHLIGDATLTGDCMRCLEQSRFPIAIESREVDQPGTGDEELASPYVNEGMLDLAGWAHDAIALAIPQSLHCREDCAGLCPVCGISLNDVEPGSHVHEAEPDPRWAKLRELTD